MSRGRSRPPGLFGVGDAALPAPTVLRPEAAPLHLSRQPDSCPYCKRPFAQRPAGWRFPNDWWLVAEPLVLFEPNGRPRTDLGYGVAVRLFDLLLRQPEGYAPWPLVAQHLYGEVRSARSSARGFVNRFRKRFPGLLEVIPAQGVRLLGHPLLAGEVWPWRLPA